MGLAWESVILESLGAEEFFTLKSLSFLYIHTELNIR